MSLDPEPRTLVRFNVVMMAVWTVLILPTVLVWKDSVLWVALISVYALIVSHFAAYDASRAERRQQQDKERLESKIDVLLEAHGREVD